MAFQEKINFQLSLAPKFRPGDRVSYSGNGDEPFYFDSKGNQTTDTNAARIDPGESWVVKDTAFVMEKTKNDNIAEVPTVIIIIEHYGYDVRIKEADIVG